MTRVLLFGWLISAVSALGAPRYLLQRNNFLPITTFNVTFRAGSADDPRGQEGVAALTARLVREGGVKAHGGNPARTRSQIEEFLFPLAAEIDVDTRREQISFTVTAPSSEADKVLAILVQMIVAPAFDAAELDRLKAETLDALDKSLPREDQEELGKLALQRALSGPTHPYSHTEEGTSASVKKLTLTQLRKFYNQTFVQERLTVGAAGVLTVATERRLKNAFQTLRRGKAPERIPAPAPIDRLTLTIVQGPFESVGVHLGENISATRAHPDFPALTLAANAFGKHRSFVGRLMRVVRELRGLNYGSYSYVEDFPEGGHLTNEPTQAARTQQAFTVWGRPSTVENGCFLLKQLYREVTRLKSEGLSVEEFDLTRSHLIGYIPLLATGLNRTLGYAVDSHFYGVKGDYLTGLIQSVSGLTRDRVNTTLRHTLHPDRMRIVVVTGQAERFKTEFLSGKCEISYPAGGEKPREILEEDKVISTFAVPVAPADIEIIKAESLF